MTTRSKLIVGLATLLGVTGAVGTTAGFAWFTTVRTATVTVENGQVYTKDGNLSVGYVSVDNNGITSNVTGSETTNSLALTTATNNVTDISGDGMSFYKPVWKASDGSSQPTEATSIGAVTNAANDVSYLSFGLKLYNGAKANGNTLDVYIEDGSAVTAANTSNAADVAAAKATRVAINDGTNLITVWQYDTDTNNKYLKKVDGSTAYGVSGYELADASLLTVWHTGTWANTTDGKNAVSGQKIATVPANSNVTVYVNMWIEGTNAAATDTAIGGQVTMSLSLSAVKVAAAA